MAHGLEETKGDESKQGLKLEDRKTREGYEK